MAERLRFLVLYDIRDPRRLRKVHEIAVDFGERLQYSVYVCDLTREEVVRLRRLLRLAMDLGEDSISIFDLGRAAKPQRIKVEHMGRRDFDDGAAQSEAPVW